MALTLRQWAKELTVIGASREIAIMTDVSGPRASYGEVLAKPQFRVLFAARALGVTSDALRSVALSILVFSRTNSPLLGAIAFTIGFLPQAIGGVFLSALADRFPARTLIMIGHWCPFLIGLLLASGRLPIAASLFLLATMSCLTPIFTGAASRRLAELFEGDAYVLGRSLFYLVAVAAQLAGLAGGGALTAWLGVQSTMLVTATLHLSAAVICHIVLSPDPERTVQRSHQSIVLESWAGNKELLATRNVAKLLLTQCLPATYLAATGSLLIPYSWERQFSPAQTGLLLACLPAGMLIGDIAVGRMLAPHTRERLVLPLLILLGSPPTAIALPIPFAITAVLLAMSGIGSAYLLGLQRRFRAAIPASRQGQGFTLLSTTTMTVQGIGPIVFGTVAEFILVGRAIALCGICSLLTTLIFRNTAHNNESNVD